MSDILHQRARIGALSITEPTTTPNWSTPATWPSYGFTERIEKVLAAAPPLTDEQRTALAELLRPA